MFQDVIVKSIMKTSSWYPSEVFLEPVWPLREPIFSSTNSVFTKCSELY